MAVSLPVSPPTPRGERGDCCPTICDYSIERVRWHLGRWLDYERAQEATDLPYSSALVGRYGGAPGDGRTAMIDVGRIVEQLRAERQPVTAEAVAARLCPWSTDACD